MKEVLMTTNAFKKSKVLNDNDAISVLITRLIMLEPGKIIGMPLNAGVGLISRYRFVDESKLSDLKSDIENQVAEFIPDGRGAEITVEFCNTDNPNKKKMIVIGVRIGMTVYAVGTDGETIYSANEDEEDTNTNKVSLSELTI